MHQRRDILIFTTAYCNPMGMQQALATATVQLENAAGVYLTCDPELKIKEPEYAITLSVDARDRTMVA